MSPSTRPGALAQNDFERFDLPSLFPPVSFSRRDFLAAGLAGFALAAQPVAAQTVIHTDSQGLAAGELALPVDGGTLPGYFARPESGKALPTVLVVQEIFGVHEYIRDVCRRLAKRGYLAIAPELYFRQGSVKDKPLDEVRAIVGKVPDAQVLADLDACAAWAATSGGDPARLAITGFCWGGRMVWLYAAHNPRLKAGVAWYGRLVGTASPLTPKQPVDLAAALKAPVLGLYGGQDAGIPVDTIDTMRAALKAAGQPSEIHVYADAPHAFHADYRPSYRQAAAEDGWRRLLGWLAEHGV